jgi:hypothetical protein
MELNLFAVLFTLGRLPGWIGHWRELISDPQTEIVRLCRVSTGHTERHHTDYPTLTPTGEQEHPLSRAGPDRLLRMRRVTIRRRCMVEAAVRFGWVGHIRWPSRREGLTTRRTRAYGPLI